MVQSIINTAQEYQGKGEDERPFPEVGSLLVLWETLRPKLIVCKINYNTFAPATMPNFL